MRYLKICVLITVLILASSTWAFAQNWQIIPGQSVGPITANTSETEMFRLFGAEKVKRMAIDVGEGETQMGTVLFPTDPIKRAYVLWIDPETRLLPESISFRDKNTVWKTDRGITIGTDLKFIEKTNGKPFELAGFAWDYEGTVTHANGGILRELGTRSGEEITGRTLLLRLSPAKKFHGTPAYKAVIGDGTFLSSDRSMQKLNPVVYEMIVEFIR